MTAKELPTAFNRQELRALYDQVVAEINASRNNNLLTSSFYAKTGDALFDVGCLALTDAITNTRRMHTVSAPPGGGKTSFSHAFVIALTRYAKQNPDAPYGSVLVVNEIEKADEVYGKLSPLLPGKIALWTTDHDVNCKEPQKVKEPAARFKREDLANFPVIIVTDRFYLGTRGHLARSVVRNGTNGVRVLTVVDEKPNEVLTLEVTFPEAAAVRDALRREHPETKEHLDALLKLMERHHYEQPNKLYRVGMELDAETITKELGWFRTSDATFLAKSASHIPGIEKLFSFGKALAIGRACIATNGIVPCFFGYQEQRVVDLTAGTILLDATADIDGISNIVPWRVETETPTARYDNLEIVHVRQHAKKNLAEYLKTAANQRAYVDWMLAIITEHMNPGEKGLVICKKCLFDAERVPHWPEGDPRFQEPKSFTKRYEWDVGGRKLCATHWGTGIGSNAWQDAGVVFLFDEFFVPRWVSAANTQGYRGHKVNEGDLGSMSSLMSKARGVDSIADGQTLRWTKQLALRGRARQYDENGMCGEQRLVVGSDLKRFMLHAPKLFPGAKIMTVGDVSNNSTLITTILELLNKTQGRVLTAKELSSLIGKDWRKVSRDVLTADFLKTIALLGWRYVPVKGRSGRGKVGTRFERIAPEQSPGVLSSNVCAQVGNSGATQV
jgi:hypothetical protein